MDEASRRYWTLVVLVAAAGIVLRSGVVDHGLAVDDFAQVAMVEGTFPVSRRPWDLYRFASGTSEEVEILRSAGSLAWWSPDDLRFAAFRPLGSLLRWAEIRFLGPDATAFAHGHALAWWAAALLAFAGLARRLVPDGVALGAVVLYACEEGHGVALSWLANRPVYVAVTFGCLALAEQVRASPRPWRIALFFALALSAGEYGLAVPIFAACLRLARAGPVERRPWLDRGWPWLAPLGVLLVVHGIGAYGARGSGVYVDPLDDPARFVQTAAIRVPVLLADGIVGYSADGVAIDPPSARGAAALGWIGLVVFLVVALSLAPDGRARRAVLAGTLGGLGTLTLLSGAFVSTRLWVLPGPALALGFAALGAWALAEVRGRVRDAWARASVIVLALLLHGPVAALRSVIVAEGYDRANRAAVAALRASDLGPLADRDVIVYAAVDPTTLLYGRFLVPGGLARSWLVLSAAPAPVRVRRPAPGRIELDVRGPWLDSPLERLFRADDPPVGLSARVGAGTVTLLRRDDAGATVRLEYDPATAPVFVLPTRGTLRRLPPPPVGASVDLPAPVAPLRSL